MEKRWKLIVADDEYLIRGMLTKMIHCDELGLELIGTAGDGESLWRMVEQEKPDLVISDISMPGMDGLEVIQRAHRDGLHTKFILISGYREFDYAYTALKYGVEDYILKPISEIELNAALSRAENQLRRKTTTAVPESSPALRGLFFKDSFLQELSASPHTVEEFNRNYGTHFVQGYFRMLKIKLDRPDGAGAPENLTAGVPEGAVPSALRETFSYCGDCLLETEQDGAIALLNYSAAESGRFSAQAAALLSALRQIEGIRNELLVTLCVSEEYTNLSASLQSRQQTGYAAWSRLVRGTGRVLFYSGEPHEIPAERLAGLESRLMRSVELLNIRELQEALTDFFRLPAAFLAGADAPRMLQRLLNHFFLLHYERLSAIQDADALRRQIEWELRCRYPMEAVQNALISSLTAALETLSWRTELRAIRMVCSLVERDYGGNLTLEHAARQVNLSPDYLSRLFKKETGRNFSEYVTGVRMDRARELLRSTALNVSEIAGAVGFSDVQYFSKTFKKIVGVKPTEYRKLYS